MAYQATILPVMIASPGDVGEERGIVREVLHDWNDVNGSMARVLLVPVGWDSHSPPELGTRPQELINTRLLKDCDLLIAVFWTRLGTPTGVAPSGTVEEIREHVAAGKPAMVYFSSRPVAPESIDPDQYQKLKDFRNEIEALGLVESYDDAQDFRRKLSKQVQLSLHKNSYLRSMIAHSINVGIVAVSNVGATQTKISLSEDAKRLLKAAAKDQTGTILNVRHLGGHRIQAGPETFGGNYGRESARWEAALEDLVRGDLIVDRGYKGEVFELTNLGWRVADDL